MSQRSSRERPRLQLDKDVGPTLSSSQFGQCGPDQLCGGFAATARVKCGPDPPIGVSAGVAKGDKGTHCIIRCRARRRRRGPRSLAEPIELVSQIEDETLGLLPS